MECARIMEMNIMVSEEKQKEMEIVERDLDNIFDRVFDIAEEVEHPSSLAIMANALVLKAASDIGSATKDDERVMSMLSAVIDNTVEGLDDVLEDEDPKALKEYFLGISIATVCATKGLNLDNIIKTAKIGKEYAYEWKSFGERH